MIYTNKHTDLQILKQYRIANHKVIETICKKKLTKFGHTSNCSVHSNC